MIHNWTVHVRGLHTISQKLNPCNGSLDNNHTPFYRTFVSKYSCYPTIDTPFYSGQSAKVSIIGKFSVKIIITAVHRTLLVQ